MPHSILYRLTSVFSLLTAAVFHSTVWSSTDQTYVCSLNNQERVIELKYPMGTPTPCLVNYSKEGDTQTLWRAQNQQGYCEEKAQEFVSKQEGWGWRCTIAMLEGDSDLTMTDEAILEATAQGISEEKMEIESEETPQAEQ